MDATQLELNIIIQILQIFLRGKVLIVNGEKMGMDAKIDSAINMETDEIPEIGQNTIVHLYTDYKKLVYFGIYFNGLWRFNFSDALRLSNIVG